MRDVVRDAAIIVVAQERKRLLDVDEFLELYEDKSSEDPNYVLDLLSEMLLVKEIWADWDIWNSDKQMFERGQYIWKWV